MTVTGSFYFAASGCRFTDFIAERVFRIILWHCSDLEMAASSDGPADGRSGVNFEVELQVPWNAPEAYVNLDSEGVYELTTVPDVLGLHSRWAGVAVVKVLLRRDSCSVHALVPDPRVIDRCFHEVTLIGMGDEAGPDVSVAELSLLRVQWPVSIMNSLLWLQQELEQLRKESKQRYRDTKDAGGSCHGAPCGRGHPGLHGPFT